jgi:hypothetical protein
MNLDDDKKRQIREGLKQPAFKKFANLGKFFTRVDEFG